jgi:hypothetical protein
VSTRNASGDAGDVLITGHIIHLDGAIYTDATASHAAGDITIDARDSLTSQKSYEVIFSPVDITITKAKVFLTDATLKGATIKIDVESDSSDLFDDTSKDGSPSEAILDYISALALSHGAAYSDAEARIEVSGGSIIADDLQMDARALSEANITTVTIFFAAAYGHSIGRSVIALKDGATLDVAGDVSLTTDSSVALAVAATQNLLGISTTVERINITVAVGYSNLVSRIEVESGVTIDAGGNFFAGSHGLRNSNVSFTAAAYKDGTLATAGNFALHESLIEVELNGSITADGDIDGSAELETEKNDATANSTVGTGGLLNSVISLTGGGPYWLGLFRSLFSAAELFDGGEEKNDDGYSAAINLAIGTNIVKASIGDGATIHAGGSVNIRAKAEELPETSALAFLSSSEVSQREAGLALALTGGIFKNTAKAWVGVGATVTAGGDLTVQSKAKVPYQIQYIVNQDLASPTTWLEKLNYNAGIQNGFFSS